MEGLGEVDGSKNSLGITEQYLANGQKTNTQDDMSDHRPLQTLETFWVTFGVGVLGC